MATAAVWTGAAAVLELEAADRRLLSAAPAPDVTFASSDWALDLAEPVAVAMTLFRLEALEPASLVIFATLLETPAAKVEAFDLAASSAVDASDLTLAILVDALEMMPPMAVDALDAMPPAPVDAPETMPATPVEMSLMMSGWGSGVAWTAAARANMTALVNFMMMGRFWGNVC